MNKQIPQSRNVREDGQLAVHSIFKTIQGEGPFSGRRALFVRLAGCNLQCPQCDTDYTKGRKSVPLTTLFNSIVRTCDHSWLIVITGGEPFRQNIEPLVLGLTQFGYTVQVETNGVLPIPSPTFTWLCSKDTREAGKCFVVCSPKTNKVHSSIEEIACAYKYVVSDGELDADGLPTRVLQNPSAGVVARAPEGTPIYVQPADSKNLILNTRNLNATKDTAIANGYILQIQLHKNIGVA